MGQMFAAEKVEKRQGDFLLICTLMLLLGVGMAMLFSSSYFRANVRFDNPLYFILNQSVYAGIGLAVAFVASRLPLERIRSLLPVLLVLSLVLMGLTFLPGIGAEYLGGRRWINVGGFSFQPSELVKVALVLYLSSVLDRKQGKLDQPSEGLLPPFLIVLAFAALIFLQNNLSTAVFVLVLSLSVFFVAGVKLRWFGLTVILLVPVVVASLFGREHRLSRVLTYLKPEEDPTGAGYQILASLSSLRHGGFAGTGIGLGTHKLGVLPEAQSDFIFAVLGEELGFVGVVAVIGLFACFAWRGYVVAKRSPTLFLRLLAFGVTTSIVVQAMVNMAVVSSLVPATGIPLPFFSSGGSSLVITLLMCGLLLNVSRQNGAAGGERDHG